MKPRAPASGHPRDEPGSRTPMESKATCGTPPGRALAQATHRSHRPRRPHRSERRCGTQPGGALAQATHRSHRPRGPRYIDPGDARGYPQRLSAGEGVTVDSLKGRVGVVTGGASGIGRAMVEAFAREGARVVVADLDEAGMAEVVGPIRSRGGEAIAVRTDVTDLASVQALAERAFDAFGRVHVLCNNAGVALWGGLETATHRDWQWVLGVNLWGVVHGLEAFLPRMIAQKEPGHG